MKIWSVALWILTVASAAPAQAQTAGDGVRLYEQGDYAGAARVLGPVVDSQPANQEAAAYLGLALVEAGQYDPAEAHLRNALGGPIGDDRLRVALARIQIERRNAEGALGELEQAAEVNPNHPDIPHYRGVALLALGRYDEAARSLEQAVQQNAGRAMTHYYLGLAYSRLNEHSRMVEHFETFLAIAPDSPQAAEVRSLLRNVR